MKHALSVTREANFPEWYQAVVRDADMAEMSAVRGCMVIKPWGYAIWELMQHDLDQRIKDTGHENCYFPLLIPLKFLAQEASHVEGFAKEMAVVTHHRLKMIDDKLQVDPTAELEEPFVIRPSSETVIGDTMQRWIHSYRDLPLLLNQWANVMRWEMRTRLFLRTSEFLWQEGHTAHADKADAMEETMRMAEVYRSFSEDVLAMPVIMGEKPEHERFPGAENTYSIEAMMQDGKALQAGTSHYLGTNFAEAQNIRYQTTDGNMVLCHTTSWGVSTRMIGGVIMVHGDDDGLRLPPAIAPRQVVIVPILRDKPEDIEVLAYCDALHKELVAGQALHAPIRAIVDKKQIKSSDKRWNWVRRGAPLIIEIGPRDVANDTITFTRRDKLRDGEKILTNALVRTEFVAAVPGFLAEIQANLFAEAKAMRDNNIRSGLKSFDDIAAYFGPAREDDEDVFHGWVRVPWCKPTGPALEDIVARLKTLKLTVRNAPMEQPGLVGPCVFTGKQGVEEILIARAY